MRKLLPLLAALAPMLLPQPVAAQEGWHHQVRLGWGDMLFETLAFHAGYGADGTRLSDFCYTGHFFAEYDYRFTRVVSVGFQADIEGIYFTETPCDDLRKPVGDPFRGHNHFLTLLPQVRFTYFDKGLVELYSGVGLGLLLAFDNRHRVEAAPTLGLTLLGVGVGNEHWGGSVELGGLNALLHANQVYMLGSRLISVGVHYRW